MPKVISADVPRKHCTHCDKYVDARLIVLGLCEVCVEIIKENSITDLKNWKLSFSALLERHQKELASFYENCPLPKKQLIHKNC